MCIFIVWCLCVKWRVGTFLHMEMRVWVCVCICVPLGFQCEQEAANCPSPTWVPLTGRLLYTWLL